MVELLRKLFGSRTPMPAADLFAQVIEAQKETIQELKSEIQYLRDERRELQILFNRSLRLEVTNAKELQQTPPTRNWNKLRTELEKKYSKPSEPSDPDKVQEYWKQRAEQMAHDAGLEPAESKDAAEIQGMLGCAPPLANRL